MPYYAWRGIGLSGATHTGKIFARSSQCLDEMLFRRDIALLSYSKSSTCWLSPIRTSCVLTFFERLAVLLNAGVLLPDALALLADTMNSTRLQLVLDDIGNGIQQGLSLSQALLDHPSLFNSMVAQLVHVGQEAGALPKALLALNAYGASHQDFARKMRSALMMPAISLLFFGALALFIIVFLLPTVMDVLAGLRHEAPPLTRAFLSIATFVRSRYMLLVVGALTLIALAFWYYVSHAGRKYWDYWIMRMPYVGPIVLKRDVGWFLSSTALLLRHGVPMISALAIARCIIQNSCISSSFEHVEKRVASGDSLSIALESLGEPFASKDIIAMVHVGEESGTLANMLEQASALYHSHIVRMFNVLSTVIQPLILLVLGLLVGLLILAVYTPLFSMIDALG